MEGLGRELQKQKGIEVKDYCQEQSIRFSTRNTFEEEIYDGFAVRNEENFLSFDWSERKARFKPLEIDPKTGELLKKHKDPGLIIVNTEQDLVLKEMCDWARSLKNLPIEQKSFLIAQKIYNLMGGRNLEIRVYIEELERSGRDVMIGEINVKNKIGGSCLHRALLFHKLAKEAGIDSRLQRGYEVGTKGCGSHIWNDIRNENGEILIVDIMYPTNDKEDDFGTITYEEYQKNGSFPKPSTSYIKYINYLDINGKKIYS